MIEFLLLPNPAEIAVSRRDYLASLTAPLDGMWEAFADAAPQWEIRLDGERAGYFCANDAGQLLQFHLGGTFESRAPGIFAEIVARDDVSGAMAGTHDPFFLSLCLDHRESMRVHTRLYEVAYAAGGKAPVLDGAVLSLVEERQLAEIVEFDRAQLEEDPGEWLNGYLERLVERRELYALRRGDEVLGTGEARASDTQQSIVDVGAVVSRQHRGQGLATKILESLVHQSLERGLRPICSTTVENVAAQKAIVRAGFVARHRLLEIGF